MKKFNEKFFEKVIDYVVTGENKMEAMDSIYIHIDDRNWRAYARELYARMRGIATPEQNFRWNEIVEEITFRAIQA